MSVNVAVANLANLLEQKRDKITDAVILPFGNPILAFFKQIPKTEITGRGLKKEVPIKTGRAGRIWTGSEGGAIHQGYDPTGILPYLELKKMMGSLTFTPEQLRAMGSSRKKTEIAFNDSMKDLTNGLKARRLCHLAERGGGSVGRINGTKTSGYVIDLSTQPLCVEGDRVESFDKRDTNTRADADDCISSPVKVTKVDYIAKKVTIDTVMSSTNEAHDGHVLAFTDEKDQSSTKWQHPSGFQAHLSDGQDVVLWDTDDATGYRRVSTYLTLDRTAGANAALNAELITASSKTVGQFRLNKLAAYAAGMADGNVKDYVAIMHPYMLMRIEKQYRGLGKQLPRGGVKLPLGSFPDIPHIPTAYGDIPAFSWVFWEDGMIALVRKGDFVQAADDAEWVQLGSGRVLPVLDGGNLVDAVGYSMRHFWNNACRLPKRQVLGYSFDTSDPT